MQVDPDARTRMSESKPDPYVGRTIDGFRIDEVIGRGGMGSVYRATQLSLGRPVAMKILFRKISALLASRTAFVATARMRSTW